MPITLNGTTGITSTELADNAVTAAKIAPNSVPKSKLANGAVKADDLDGGQTGAAPIFGCRAWVNFDGTRDTTGAVSTANTNRFIRASGNVTSVQRVGVGLYQINFTTAMPDANYAMSGFNTDPDSAGGDISFVRYGADVYTANAVQVRSTFNTTGYDTPLVSVQIFR